MIIKKRKKISNNFQLIIIIVIIYCLLYYWELQGLDYLGKSRGIERTRELAMKHANLASVAISSLPENDDEDVQKSRWALIELTQRVITRSK